MPLLMRKLLASPPVLDRQSAARRCRYTWLWVSCIWYTERRVSTAQLRIPHPDDFTAYYITYLSVRESVMPSNQHTVRRASRQIIIPHDRIVEITGRSHSKNNRNGAKLVARCHNGARTGGTVGRSWDSAGFARSSSTALYPRSMLSVTSLRHEYYIFWMPICRYLISNPNSKLIVVKWTQVELCLDTWWWELVR